MSTFLKDTVDLNKKLSEKMDDGVKDTPSVSILPYFVHPETGDIVVVVKREVLPGMWGAKKIAMSFTALSTEVDLSKERQDLKELLVDLGIDFKIVNGGGVGNVMLDPKNSSKDMDLVLVEIEPNAEKMVDFKKGIIYQEKGKFEIGFITMNEALHALEHGFISDVILKTLLSELYLIMLNVEEQQRVNGLENQGNPDDMGMSDSNSETDFGKIYKLD